MGTINYRSSDIITLGYNADYELEEGFDEEDKAIQDEESYNNSKFILENYNYTFNWFKLELKEGYYEGYYLDLDKNYDVNYLDSEEIKEIKEEIHELECLLLELLENTDMIVCHPWWCTSWEDYETSKKLIKESMKKLRKELI